MNINQGLPHRGRGSADHGYRAEEAKQFVEFCIELDNQDDRLKDNDNRLLHPNIDPQLWNPVPTYDSRSAVARDVVQFRNSDDKARAFNHWAKLYKQIIADADTKYPRGWNEAVLFADPDLNGYGPWQNAWTLYEGRGNFKGAYAIAIRGTVFSSAPSVAEDAFFHPVSAAGFLSRSVRFAEDSAASIHSGFAHATFTLLLDDKYGVLRALDDMKVPGGADLFIVGHSQGAAMVTLVHSFLHYAMRGDDAFGLKAKNFRLKSYAIAQPKIGNYSFGADFARITQPGDNAIVVNNHIDPVAKIPLTLQATGDLDNDFRGGSFLARALRMVSGFGLALRRAISSLLERFVKDSATGYGYFYQYDSIKPIGRAAMASSWNFLPAGHVLMVFGTPGDPKDPFLQHHATTYRALISEQLKD